MGISALEYHRQTGYDRHEMKGHGLDWANQPGVFKTYPGLKTVPLSQVIDPPEGNLSFLIKEGSRSDAPTEVTLDKLSQILLLAHSVTAKARSSGTDFYYRSVASAGALYPFELYVGTQNVSGLDDGLYHHSIGLHALTLLRSGNIMRALSHALQTRENHFPVVSFFLTSIFFRSSWKYRDRAYRYSLLDTGHLAESLCLALTAADLPFHLYYDFDDEKTNSLLGVDSSREVCLAVICLYGTDASDKGDAKSLKTGAGSLADASRVSSREIDYRLIREIHAASSSVAQSSQGVPKMLHNLGLKMEQQEQQFKIDKWPEKVSYAEAVFKRRSKRNFISTGLSSDGLFGLLELLCAGCHVEEDAGLTSRDAISVGFLSGNVQDLDPGFYMLDPEHASMALVSQGRMIGKMARICLDQAWLANCALHFCFLSNLELLEQTWGPRGYRYAMLTAGRLGQRIYLGATSMGFGCCGIGAFFDDEAAQMLDVNDQTRLLYLLAAGPVKR
ncbi:MAG: SagB/ThcOx family dehydrogenase [Deltaproteobacteria bacterium]|nr:SagB/ThcOx family dehydrogenase [Deltaproteobacteria bacterium]